MLIGTKVVYCSRFYGTCCRTCDERVKRLLFLCGHYVEETCVFVGLLKVTAFGCEPTDKLAAN